MGNETDRGQRPKVAVVIHRFVADSGGGAEEHCRRLVMAVKDAWELDVLTTCARDHHSWGNELVPGITEEEGFRLIRFPVARRKRRILSALLSRSALRIPHPARLEDFWLRALGPDCPELERFLEGNASAYRCIIFYTYLYGTTVFGLRVAGPRTLLIPTAHDEPAFHLRGHRRSIASAGAFAFLTSEERELVLAVPGVRGKPELILGAELEPRAFHPGDGERFRQRYGVEGPFLLYLGRIERSKGLAELLAAHAALRAAGGASAIPLVLAGKAGPLPIPPGVRSLGYLSEEEKRGALAAAVALVQPSARESLSLVLLEAWAQRRPVIANGRSAPLAGQCQRSGGGLTYLDAAEYGRRVRELEDPTRREQLGESGHRFVREHYREGILRERLVPFVESLGWVRAAAVPAASVA